MRKGFTLIEVVMIIVILGILAAVAIPRFYNLQTEAQISAEAGVIGGVRAGVATYYANQCVNIGTCAYPVTLDAAADGACTVANSCFDSVLSQGGITDDWSKAALIYTGPTGTAYTYTPATGTFE